MIGWLTSMQKKRPCWLILAVYLQMHSAVVVARELFEITDQTADIGFIFMAMIYETVWGNSQTGLLREESFKHKGSSRICACAHTYVGKREIKWEKKNPQYLLTYSCLVQRVIYSQGDCSSSQNCFPLIRGEPLFRSSCNFIVHVRHTLTEYLLFCSPARPYCSYLGFSLEMCQIHYSVSFDILRETQRTRGRNLREELCRGSGVAHLSVNCLTMRVVTK